MKSPNEINIQFTESDRKGAGHPRGHKDCLIAHALKRRGYKEVSVGIIGATVNGAKYDMAYAHGDLPFVHSTGKETAPFYKKSIVGKKIKLVKSR